MVIVFTVLVMILGLLMVRPAKSLPFHVLGAGKTTQRPKSKSDTWAKAMSARFKSSLPMHLLIHQPDAVNITGKWLLLGCIASRDREIYRRVLARTPASFSSSSGAAIAIMSTICAKISGKLQAETRTPKNEAAYFLGIDSSNTTFCIGSLESISGCTVGTADCNAAKTLGSKPQCIFNKASINDVGNETTTASVARFIVMIRPFPFSAQF